MNVKLFEIRDRGTYIAAIAIQLASRNEAERFMLSRSGYGKHPKDHSRYIMLARLEGGKITYDAFAWGDTRTMPAAHNYINQHWDELLTGSVIDVEYILGETKEPKVSEAFL